jgi:hypothetical protein
MGGAIHPWELVAWRQASSRRLWERLQRALPALTASLDLSGTPPHNTKSNSVVRINEANPAAVTAAELQASLKALAAQAATTAIASVPTSSAASTFVLLLRACRQCHSLLHAPSLLPELFFPFEQQASVYVFCYTMFFLPSFPCLLHVIVSLSVCLSVCLSICLSLIHLLLPACLHILTPHGTSLTIPVPQLIINRHNTRTTYYLTGMRRSGYQSWPPCSKREWRC